MITRKCAGCGYAFRAEPGAAYCSSICAGGARMASVLGALQRLAEVRAVVHGERERRMSH
jgi:hypothetical protein